MIMPAFFAIFILIHSVSFNVIYYSQPDIFESLAERQEKGI